jgi:hypothetical protein
MTGTSRFKGVSKQRKKWRSYIKVKYRQINLGFFADEVCAAEAYDKAAVFWFGSFARLNFPEKICDYLEKIYGRAT